MKKVEIFVKGYYEYKFKTGTWVYYLNYKQYVIKRVGKITTQGNPDRMILLALYKALNAINQPCKIEVHSKYKLGFEHPKKSKNKDLIFQIQNTINKAGHIMNFDTTDDFGRVDIWEQIYGTNIESVDINKENPFEDESYNNETPNDIFKDSSKALEIPDELIKSNSNIQNEIDNNLEKENLPPSWRDMYDDIMGPSGSAWVPGSGGY